MNNPLTKLLLLGSAILFFIQACTGAESVEIELTEPPTQPVLESPLPVADLAHLTTGTSMRWFDNNILVFHSGGEFLDVSGSDPEGTFIVEDFWIDKYNVTNDMYRACMQAGVCSPPEGQQSFPAEFDPLLKDHPIIGVNWVQAQNYCGWMDLRLPMENEWSVASRASTDPKYDSGPYPWGETEPSCRFANFENCKGTTSGVMDHPEGQSASSVFDMAGNVKNWTQEKIGEERGIIGSSFKSSMETDSNIIISVPPGEYSDDLGFRCAIAAASFAGIDVLEDIEDARLLLPGFNPACQVPANVAQIPPERPACGEVLIAEGPNCNMSNSGLGGVQYLITVVGDEIVWYHLDLAACSPANSDPQFLTGNCFGPMASTIPIEICTECTPEEESFLNGPPCFLGGGQFCEDLPDEGPDCSQGYISQDDHCAVVVPPPNYCPAGMEMDETDQCCYFSTQLDPPTCWLGFSYDDETGMCVSHPDLYPPVIDCQTYDLHLATCSQSQQQDKGCNNTCKFPKTLDPDTCECK